MILMGFDVTKIPTADVMELAAQLLELDERTIKKLIALAQIFGGGEKLPVSKDHNATLAALLRERAAVVRALEMRPAGTELDS